MTPHDSLHDRMGTLSPLPNEALLMTAKVITGGACGIMIFAMVMLCIGALSLPTALYGATAAKLASVGLTAGYIWLLAGSLLLIALMLYCGVRITLELFAMIQSVERGTPFMRENAARLNRMGWWALAAQVIALILMGIEHWAAPYFAKLGEEGDLGFGMDLGGLLLILVLFILARVFREGTQLREDAEGTI